MAVGNKNYTIFDLATRQFVRSPSSTAEVAFSKISVGGAEGPVLASSGSNFDMGSVRLLNVADPTSGTDAINKNYVDSDLWSHDFTNIEGSSVVSGNVVFSDDSASVQLAQASDTLSQFVGVIRTGGSDQGTVDVWDRPGAIIEGSYSAGKLTGGFLLGAWSLGANPLATTLSSTTVTVTLPQDHGLDAGDIVTLANLTTFNGLQAGDVTGDKTVVATPAANTFTYTSGTAATGTGSGGGSSGIATLYILAPGYVYVSRTDGKMTQYIGNFQDGDTVFQVGTAISKTAFILDPLNVVTIGTGTTTGEETGIVIVNKNFTLLASQTNTVASDLTFDKTVYNGCEVNYRVKNNTSGNVRVGTIRVATDGTLVDFDDSGFVETASTGVTWDVDISGSNVRFLYTSGAETNAFRCEVKKFKV